MDKIIEIASKYDLKIIEDCAQAHGTKINKRHEQGNEKIKWRGNMKLLKKL